MSINKVILEGRITRLGEVVSLPNQLSVRDFSIAHNTYKMINSEKVQESTFLDCTAFSKNEYTWGALNRATVGQLVFITGRLHQSRWVDKVTQKPMSRIKVVVDSLIVIPKSPKTDVITETDVKTEEIPF